MVSRMYFSFYRYCSGKLCRSFRCVCFFGSGVLKVLRVKHDWPATPVLCTWKPQRFLMNFSGLLFTLHVILYVFHHFSLPSVQDEDDEYSEGSPLLVNSRSGMMYSYFLHKIIYIIIIFIFLYEDLYSCMKTEITPTGTDLRNIADSPKMFIPGDPFLSNSLNQYGSPGEHSISDDWTKIINLMSYLYTILFIFLYFAFC